ncbi:hypothetical protein AOXY_G22685 [Acipenser oxyrinchus oxyrinchus]|uniref:Uncharacterized protein n=1 Tax=Acipenser oxyrinchus oxyrinchus TaxID=40147 RepID=A0AAD8CVT6_ACIOX|nr:hypothetical protein AOXY_G22685 [Acipenser oxyrinchus oxyrinchus]
MREPRPPEEKTSLQRWQSGGSVQEQHNADKAGSLDSQVPPQHKHRSIQPVPRCNSRLADNSPDWNDTIHPPP